MKNNKSKRRKLKGMRENIYKFTNRENKNQAKKKLIGTGVLWGA